MSRPRVKTIRAVTPAVEVLQIVQASGGVSLNDIHRELSLPKATLLRILLTLQDAGLVWQRIVDNAYLASYSLKENARHLDDVSHLVEVASPILSQLTRRVDWPSILAVPRLDHMEVIETNSPHSYFPSAWSHRFPDQHDHVRNRAGLSGVLLRQRASCRPVAFAS
jgi:IclR family mhp operon transcriptional activator